MLFSGKSFYSIYLNPDSSEPISELEAVKSGFNIWAFLFTGIWALVNKLWSLALLIFCVNVSIIVLSKQGFINPVSAEFIGLLFNIWVAFEASYFKEQSLEHQGYVLSSIEHQASVDEAKLSYVAKYNQSAPQSLNNDFRSKNSGKPIISDDLSNAEASKSFA